MISAIGSIFWNRRERRLPAFWRLILHVPMVIALTIGFFLPLVVVDSMWMGVPHAVFEMAEQVVANVATLCSVVVAAVLLDRRRWKSLGFGPNFALELGGGLALGAIAMLSIFAIEYALGWVTITGIGLREELSLAGLVYQVTWLVMLIAVGFGEEAVSRGYHLKNIAEGARRLGIPAAVIIASIVSSLVFALLHAANPNASWVSTNGIFLAGIMFATARIATGSLGAPIGVHITWNYFQGPVLGFPISGIRSRGSFVELIQGGNELWSGGDFGPEAGLVGWIAEGVLICVFLVWGVRRRRFGESFTELVRFRPRWKRRTVPSFVEQNSPPGRLLEAVNGEM